ncbi:MULTISPECIES: pheST operon leader peptide PheM [Providencia]|nr:pheST operon leader peptide PheM [Providencia rettgeri]QIF59929.1 pheST operon leader peptide PheM [Providencia sp. 1701011]QIF63931.1 pheST operon leader peptide PheM [Providencia sp. 1701091]EIJ7165845.1 pheST operon leader peptide PheM [Providencia rettgeri]EJD6045531.1 pheST operon leader peptide PheM [Providencia rettgeri]
MHFVIFRFFFYFST